jgi:LAGLIDADG DNA endonuclease family protein
MIEKHILAYCAGYIDGDGCFHIRRQETKTGNIKYQAKFILSSTDQNILYFFKEIFGGVVRLSGNKINTHKPQYHFILENKNLEIFRNVIPYLVEKRDEANLFLNYFKASSKIDRQHLFEEMKHVKNHQNLVFQIQVDEFKELSQTENCSSFDYAYLAGFIDAECSLGITRSKDPKRPNFLYKIYLHCNNTKWPVFRWLMKRFGGCLRLVKRKEQNNKHKDQLSWRISSKRLAEILPNLTKYLKYKKPVAEELMNFYETTITNGGDRQSYHFTELYSAILSQRDLIFNKVHLLNRKGV